MTIEQNLQKLAIMGIPAYFKHLIESYKGLLNLVLYSTTGVVTSPSHLHLDLNCAIYHCVRKLQREKPYNPARKVEWEKALCNSVYAYVTLMVDHVKPTKELNIAIDGVVPRAKMRQQRQRRFKSAYLREETVRIAERIKYTLEPQWDTNAITPGTEFMTLLSNTLRQGLPGLRAKVPTVLLSDSNEPGEGEHKVMARIRTEAVSAADYHVVYGLDADLILLSMLQAAAGHRMALLREAVEFGKVVLDADNKETLVFFDICRLTRIMTHNLRGVHSTAETDIDPDLIRDYVFLCSLLGNDFVPHGFSLAIHDDGLERAVDIYTEICSSSSGSSRQLIKIDDLGVAYYDVDTLSELFRLLAEREEGWLIRWRKRRVGLTSAPRASEDPLQYELNVLEEWPLTQMRTELSWDLHDSTYYYEHLLGHSDTDLVVNKYLTALEWVLQYYTGRTVDTTMYYPWNIPPMWRDLATLTPRALAVHLNSKKVLCDGDPKYVTPQQQAAMVFPASSYSLVAPQYKHLPATYPEYFPESFGFYVVGRRFMWQCEPVIPMLPAELVVAAGTAATPLR